MARRNHNLVIYDTVTGQRTVVTPSPVGAFVRGRKVPTLPPELYHVAQAYERSLYCEPGDPWDATDLVNFLEPDVQARITGTFTVDHWSLEDEAAAMFDVSKVLFPGNVFVRVFHVGIGSADRLCQRCGTVVGAVIERVGGLG